jgi:hypothetical protein
MDDLDARRQSEIDAIRHPKPSSVGLWLPYLSREPSAER